MASEQVREVVVRRHVFTSERPFASVLDGIYGGISQPDIGQLFEQARGEHLLRAIHLLGPAGAGQRRPDAVPAALDLDSALALDPQAQGQAGRRLVRLIAGNPVTMGQMTRHVPDAGSYAPVTILIQELPDGGTRVAYDSVTSEIAPYHDAAASEVAERLDGEVLGLLRQVTGASASASP